MRGAAGVLLARRAHPGRQEWRRGGGEHAHMLEVAHLLEGGHLVRVRVRVRARIRVRDTVRVRFRVS